MDGLQGGVCGVWCALWLAGTRGATEVYDGAERNAVGLQGGVCGVWCALWLAGTRGATEVYDGAERNAVGLQGGVCGVWCALWLAGTRGATEVYDGAERNAYGLQGGGWGVLIAVADKKCGGGSKTCPQPIRVEGGHPAEICKRPPKSSGGGRLQISAGCLPETAKGAFGYQMGVD